MENNEEKIPANTEIGAGGQETQIMEPERVLEMPKEDIKKKKRDFYIELALFFILGILIGVAVKTEASKRITMGYEDYKMRLFNKGYDINKIQKDLMEEQIKESQNNEEEGLVDDGGESISKDNEGNETE